MYHAQMASPFGRVLLCSNGAGLTGLYFVGQSDCPPLDGLPVSLPKSADPTAGLLSGIPLKGLRVRRAQQDLDLFSGSMCVDAMPGQVGPVQLMQAGTPEVTAHLFERVHQELNEYFVGERTSFTVPLHLQGSDFQLKVWNALSIIPYGEYVSYADVARMAGLSPQHGRPVGTAVGRNPITIIVPCHRVLSASGTLNGYSGGLERKLALLQLEGFTVG